MVLEKDELSLSFAPYRKTSGKFTSSRKQKLKANLGRNRGYQAVLSKEAFISINIHLTKKEKEEYSIEL